MTTVWESYPLLACLDLHYRDWGLHNPVWPHDDPALYNDYLLVGAHIPKLAGNNCDDGWRVFQAIFLRTESLPLLERSSGYFTALIASTEAYKSVSIDCVRTLRLASAYLRYLHSFSKSFSSFSCSSVICAAQNVDTNCAWPKVKQVLRQYQNL